MLAGKHHIGEGQGAAEILRQGVDVGIKLGCLESVHEGDQLISHDFPITRETEFGDKPLMVAEWISDDVRRALEDTVCFGKGNLFMDVGVCVGEKHEPVIRYFVRFLESAKGLDEFLGRLLKSQDGTNLFVLVGKSHQGPLGLFHSVDGGLCIFDEAVLETEEEEFLPGSNNKNEGAGQGESCRPPPKAIPYEALLSSSSMR